MGRPHCGAQPSRGTSRAPAIRFEPEATSGEPLVLDGDAAKTYIRQRVGSGAGWSEVYGVIMDSMTIHRIKGTYSLDAGTVRELDRLARRWKTSKSEALRRAIRAAAAAESRREGGGDARAISRGRAEDG